jgi:hypothetical protein
MLTPALAQRCRRLRKRFAEARSALAAGRPFSLEVQHPSLTASVPARSASAQRSSEAAQPAE